MFDLDASKIIIVGVAALIFIPPKDLPRVMRQVGQFVGKMRRMANEFRGQFMDAMREADMADLRKEAQKLSDAARIDTPLNSLQEYNQPMRPLGEAGAEGRTALGPLPEPSATERVEPEPTKSAAPETEPQHTA